MTFVHQAWKPIISSHENIDNDFQDNAKANRMYFLQKRRKNRKILVIV